MDKFIQNVPQIVPESWCLKCQICCRFPDTKEVQTPTWSEVEKKLSLEQGAAPDWFESTDQPAVSAPKLEPCGGGYRCPAFRPTDQHCTIYSVRPLDCRIYPFQLAQNSAGTKIMLAMDTKCPYIQEHQTDPAVLRYAQQLASYLETSEGLDYLAANPKIVGPYWPEFLDMAAMPKMTTAVHSPAAPPHSLLQPFTMKQLPALKAALSLRKYTASMYTPAGIMGWMDLLHYWWASIDGDFCLFAEQGGGLFMPLPPLTAEIRPKTMESVWKILTEANHGAGVSRIEGIGEEQTKAYQALGFEIQPTESEYLYQTEELIHLRGDRYKSQRNEINQCVKQGPWIFRPFEDKDLLPCLQLYTLWGIHKQQKSPESFSKALFRDGLFFHRRLMMSHREFGVSGYVMEHNGQICGYTFGAPISLETFGVFLEITDPAISGASTWIFREFCQQAQAFPMINAMSDADSSGLRQSKTSYHPARALPLFSLTRSLW